MVIKQIKGVINNCNEILDNTTNNKEFELEKGIFRSFIATVWKTFYDIFYFHLYHHTRASEKNKLRIRSYFCYKYLKFKIQKQIFALLVSYLILKKLFNHDNSQFI